MDNVIVALLCVVVCSVIGMCHVLGMAATSLLDTREPFKIPLFKIDGR